MEYKIINGKFSDVQKILNQWKHDFKVTILGQSVYNDHNEPIVVLTVLRERK